MFLTPEVCVTAADSTQLFDAYTIHSDSAMHISPPDGST